MNRSLVLLSGEGTSVPEAEARALFLAYDPGSRFESPEKRVLLVDSLADPFVVASRVAFSRRVGRLIEGPLDDQKEVQGRRVRLRSFDLGNGKPGLDPRSVLRGVDAKVDLRNPDFEFSLVRGEKDYVALTKPGKMSQAWSRRRPRVRAFFHPSAIFPKLARALVNLSRFREGEVFLDPFSGTGSLAIEAFEAGARVVASDQAAKMALGSLANMRHFGQEWMGVIRADAFSHPVRHVDAIATDLPYGRASSTRGVDPRDIAQRTLATMPLLLKEGSRMVVMHPQTLRVEGSAEMVLEEEHHLYVHKLLTRTITVLRRR
jgi:putative methyltransferase (TIGR01177 family)